MGGSTNDESSSHGLSEKSLSLNSIHFITELCERLKLKEPRAFWEAYSSNITMRACG